MAKSIKFNISLSVNGKEQLVSATANVNELKKAVAQSSSAMQNMLSCVNNWGFAFQNLSTSVKSISGALNTITAESRTFGAAMASANTMAGKSGEGFSALKRQVSELSETIPIARDQLANGLYQVISNGVPEDNWIEYLEKSAKASVGGIANLEEVVKVTSTVIKNYGLSWSDAGDIQDKIQLTAKNGVTSFEQMAQALPRVTANASTLGVGIDELMAAFATLTGVSGNTAEVSTQLAAIFTALIKPSSEATTMAQKMGIQFDAASIKAAGGMKNFLAQLNDAVKTYASTSGMLEQEVYGKLFGSAESLRALTPLMGNLADKFEENTEAMEGSAGTIDKAFEIMGNTGSAQLQKLNNKFGEFTDIAQMVAGNILPYLNFGSQFIVTASAAGTLVTTLKEMGIVTRTLTVTTTLWNAASVRMSALTQVCSASMRGAAVSAQTLKLAIQGLLISTGVGVAIAALTGAIALFSDQADGAKSSTEDFSSSEEAFASTSAQTQTALDDEIKKLKNLIAAKKDTSQAVKDLNDKYGTVFGNHQTAADWYDTLTRKSKIYAKQLGYEAQMKVLSTQLAEKQIQLESNYDKRRELWKSGGAQITHRRGIYDSMGNKLDEHVTHEDTEAYTGLKNEGRELLSTISSIQKKINIAEKKMAECANQITSIDNASKKHNQTLSINKLSYAQIGKEIEKYKSKLADATNNPAEAKRLNGILKQLQARKAALEKTYSGLSTSKKGTKKEPKFYQNPTTDEQLSKNISYYNKKLNGKDTPEQRVLIKKINLWERMRKEIELAKKAQLVPLQLNSNEDVEKALDYLKLKKELAKQEDKPAIDKKIAKTELRGAELNRPAVLETYQDIDREIEYQQKLKNTASREAVEDIQNEIDRLEKLKQFRTVMDDLNDQLSNAQKSFNNATTVEAKVKAQTDINRIQSEINAATNGKVTINAEVEPSYIVQGSTADKRQSYENAQTKANAIKQDYDIGLIGVDEAKRQLLELNTELSKLGLKPIKIELDNTGFDKVFDKIKDGWGSIQGVAGGIDSITSALDGNKNAWEVMSGVINGTIQVMEGISSIVEFVNMLTGATQAQTAATNSDTAASVANAAAKAAEATASITNTAAKSGEAVAETTESGAKLPFPANIAAIAAGVAAVVGALALVGSFATGGIIPGSSYSGDKLTAHVNSGEMILNASQQKRLFAIANGNIMPQMAIRKYSMPEVKLNTSAMGGISRQGGSHQSVTLKLKGRNLVGALANETRISSRSGRRTNIQI
jgi:TP901 family phage tail tape measure protein